MGRDLHTYTADARPWLQATRAHYDMILLDAYRQPYIPFYLVTHEFFEVVKRHLNPGGVFVVNVGHLPGSDALEKVVSATLRSVFAVVVRDRVSDTNSLVVASSDPLSGARMLADHDVVPVRPSGPAGAGRGTDGARRCVAARCTPTTSHRSNG